jgi:uracil-DNA glycosylase
MSVDRPKIPASWQGVLADETAKPYYQTLMEFLDQERTSHDVFPAAEDVFAALEYTPYEQTNVLLLGQDPYPTPGHAHGLCFSVRPGVRLPGSLANMYKELASDLGIKAGKNGYLAPWAKQGMLMLNAVLTVRSGAPNSHKDKGWEQFTDAIIRKVNERTDPVVFVLWGAYAQKKAKLIDGKKHTVLKGTHPSPLSASSGFFGSKPFSGINAALRKHGKPEIDWKLPE